MKVRELIHMLLELDMDHTIMIEVEDGQAEISDVEPPYAFGSSTVVTIRPTAELTYAARSASCT